MQVIPTPGTWQVSIWNREQLGSCDSPEPKDKEKSGERGVHERPLFLAGCAAGSSSRALPVSCEMLSHSGVCQFCRSDEIGFCFTTDAFPLIHAACETLAAQSISAALELPH